MLLHIAGLTAPLFLLVLLGYALSRFGWPRTASDALTRFVFTIAIPTLLFRLMSDFGRLPRVDARLLIAFFGGCLVVYVMGRIVAATLFRMDGVGLPDIVDETLSMVSQAAVPLSLITLGMGLAEFGVRTQWRESAAIAVLKLVAQPAVVYGFAWLLGLPALETAAIVMLAALPIGANVYLMSRQFGVLSGAVASAIVLTTAIGAFSMPIMLTLIGAGSLR